MKYQTKYNTKACQNLLQVFIYMIGTKQITYNEFSELTGENNFAYTKVMKTLNQMITSLNMKLELTKGYSKSIDNQYESNIYSLVLIDDPYHIETDNVDPNELIQYSMVIVYCLLKNKQYITRPRLSTILPDFNKDVFRVMKDKMLDIISEDLDINEINSYILVEE